MTSDEQNVAQIGVELLDANDDISGLYQIALAETDDELTLPAVVVTARHEEDTGIMLGNSEVKRYSLTVEIRGIQQRDAVTDLDEGFRAIDVALHPSTPQTVPSASLFKGIMIDIQTGSDSSLPRDSRIRSRTYDLFAAEAEGS
jgi:hypothetical protein